MSASFDPYHRWLSIPPDEQPAHHYRLLGLRALESDIDVIASAAERQILHVRSFLDTPMQPFAINLMRELNLARRCLLDPDAKAAYDAWLAQRLNTAAENLSSHLSAAARTQGHDASSNDEMGKSPRGSTVIHPGSVVDHSPALTQVGIPGPQVEDLPAIMTTRVRRKKQSATGWFLILIQSFVGGTIGLLAAYAILCMIDPSYDFLNLIAKQPSLETSKEESHSLEAERPEEVRAHFTET